MGKRKEVSRAKSSVKVEGKKIPGVNKLKGDPVGRSLKDVREMKTVIKKYDTIQSVAPLHGAVEMGGKMKLPGLHVRTCVPKEKLIKYARGPGVNERGIVTSKLKQKEKEIEFAFEQAARTEVLLVEDGGFLEADEGETTLQFSQKQICNHIDITSATKHFELHLNKFGPYRLDYSRSGHHLLIGGRHGHVAAVDWGTKNLLCEINVMEEVFDVQWLHNETLFAVAQKKWTYIYDKAGVELHCLKQLDNVLRMEFLPYHFLLVTCSDRSFVSWLDVSIGSIVAQFPTHLGRLNLITQNPYNAVVCMGHASGIVSMWSPNSREPLAKMLCHKRPLQAICVDPSGRYMATSAVDKRVRIWDVRMLSGPLQDYQLRATASHLDFSQRALLAMSLGDVVEVYRDCCTAPAERAYMRHRLHRAVSDMRFCPFEDVLGLGSQAGFTSLVIPGAGEPNVDALEWNPYAAVEQRREKEVKALLEKIQPEFITLDPNVIAEVDVPTLKQKTEAQQKLMLLKPRDIDFTPRQRKGRRKGAVRLMRSKQIVKEQYRRQFSKTLHAEAEKTARATASTSKNPPSVLDRFLPRKLK